MHPNPAQRLDELGSDTAMACWDHPKSVPARQRQGAAARHRPRTLSPCFFSWKLTLAGLSGDFKLHGSPLSIYRLTTNEESRWTVRPQTPELSRLLAQKAIRHQPRPRRRLCHRFPIFRGKADQLTVGLKGFGASCPTTVPIVAAAVRARSFPGPYIVACPPCLYFYIRSPACVTELRLLALVLRLNESVCL